MVQHWCQYQKAVINHYYKLNVCRICTTVGVSPEEELLNSEGGVAEESHDLYLSAADVDAVFGSFMCGLSDYTIHSKGDIGAGVREAAMMSIRTLFSLLATHNELLSPEMYCNIAISCHVALM